MTEIINLEQTGSIISTSRTFQEMLKIEHGSSAYRVLAATLDTSMPYIDKLAEDLGLYLAGKAVADKYDEQYFDPKYGKFKNFLTRNLYIDPSKKEKMEQERYTAGLAASFAAEAAIKFGARGIQAWANHCDVIKTFGEIYALLNSFANTDTDGANIRGANIELAKIRNAFPVSSGVKKSILKKYGEAMLPQDLPAISALLAEGGSSLSENLAYMLYSICCQKFGDDERGTRQLMDYYNLIGYHGNMAKEMIRESAESYNVISNDQVNYLKISRGIINNIAVKIPEINIDRLRVQADEMAKYDPYSIRRNKAQNVAGGASATLAGIFSKRPDLVIQGASTALSQLKLENNDNAVEFLEKQFMSNGVDNNAFGFIFKQSRGISDQASKFE